ncbi:MAG: SUMF1/EgtB/PvdO family nonheme iron enzyme [Pseudomonadota bacterium]|nr:SUMF1/EgtB/PvdO family nonheme iron enzyme [Pseudomonadota bacterium]MEA3411328.1 SUMF1/EgtB/PvdO family nonheme iron enzyme [Pseudomonadota bacterium]
MPRVIRGGSWNNKPDRVRSSARNRNNTDNRNNNLGFRVLRAASPPAMPESVCPGVSRSVQAGVHDPFSWLRKEGKAE